MRLWNNLWAILFLLSLPASVSDFFMESRVISFNLFLPFSDIYWNKNKWINVWRCLEIVLIINFVFCLKTVYFLRLFCLTRFYRVLDLSEWWRALYKSPGALFEFSCFFFPERDGGGGGSCLIGETLIIRRKYTYRGNTVFELLAA